jgi:phosphatidate cytidylyltransferase
LKNFAVRSLTGFIFVLGIISGLIFSKYGFLVLFSLIIVFTLWEFYILTYNAFARPQKYFGILIGLLFFVATYLYVGHKVDAKIYCFFIPLFISIFIFELYRKSKRPFNNIAYTILGLFYVALPISLFNYYVFYYTTEVVYNYHIILGFFVLLWANDTGAYLVGVSIGRNRLFERISPKKSWEGFIGGILFALIVAYFFI